ncbi:DUF4260 domain-containing protein [Chitinophaga alhagiae]|uniref:DUF4260 domain-containing protein n=1 Tax=Chitinophaga alhagiae TaxID=2203219 RepID=UPI000E5BF583|nr:DUF4260 domain-containing protein [Chitinophaga alhagiae]
MNKLLKLEEAAMFLLALLMFAQQTEYPWWLFAACLLLPDLSMIGYAAGPATGAYVYNFFHHKGVALLTYFAGVYFVNEALTFTGIILFAHASMDRVFGYGLKFMTGFSDTHLGKIGKKQ